MSYTPKTDEQLAKEACLPDGDYDFEVMDTSDKPSKNNSDMFTLKLTVYDGEGNPNYVTDYIALSSNYGERKLRAASVACGIIDIYNSGNLIAADFKGKSGRARLKTQQGDVEYPNPKNVVQAYLPKALADNSAPRPGAATGVHPLDDSIPF